MLICGIYVHKARVVSAPNFFVLQLFAKTVFFSISIKQTVTVAVLYFSITILGVE